MLLQQAIAYISRKRTKESGPFSDSPLDPLLLVFLFFTDASGRKVGGPYQQSAGTSFALTSKQGDTPFALKEAEKVRELSGVGAMVPQYESPVRILVKRR